MGRLNIVLVLIVFLSGCASAPSLEDVTNDPERENWEEMIGFWYAEIVLDDGTVRRELVNRTTDGVMVIQFELIDPDGTRRQEGEVLRWGLHGDIYMTELVGLLEDEQFHPVRVYRPRYHIAYRVLSLEPDRFVYQPATGGAVYTLKRIDPVFDISDVPVQSQ